MRPRERQNLRAGGLGTAVCYGGPRVAAEQGDIFPERYQERGRCSVSMATAASAGMLGRQRCVLAEVPGDARWAASEPELGAGGQRVLVLG